MDHISLRYRPDTGWSSELPHDWDGPRTVVLVFGAPEMARHAAAFDELNRVFGRSLRIGCSTSGEIEGGQVYDASLSVAVARFQHTDLKLASTPIAGPADSYAAGLLLAAQLAGPGLKAVFVLSDGLCVNGTPLAAGLGAGLGPEVKVTGGLAGDGSRFGETWVWSGAECSSHRVAAVGFYGDHVRVGHGCQGGWSDFGPERRITRSEGNVLYELDGKPALDLYKTYLGERAAGLPGTALLFPLAVSRSDGQGHVLVRTILSIDEEKRTMTFAGDVPQGGVARLMRANADRLISSASDAARQAKDSATTSNGGLVISVSCVGRRLVLGERTEEEVENVIEESGRRASHIGFYSYGEISPLAEGGASELHNQTMTVTVIDEA